VRCVAGLEDTSECERSALIDTGSGRHWFIEEIVMKALAHTTTTVVLLVGLTLSTTACSSSCSAKQVAATASLGTTEASASRQEAKGAAALADLPLCFEQNLGQVDSEAAFLARGGGYTLFLTPSEMVLSLRRGAQQTENKRDDARSHRDAELAPPLPPSVSRMRLVGADKNPRLVGEQELETNTNYFIGNDPEKWRTDVPNFGRVRYEGVYPGVDVVYYGNKGNLEYDFVVAPGADPSGVMMEWVGAETIDIDEQGGLVLSVDGGAVRLEAPVLYQEKAAGRAPVGGQYLQLGATTIGLRLGGYDASLPLVIDPLLTYSTFLGGNGDDCAYGIAAGSAGVSSSATAYVTGTTASTNFPSAGGFDPSFAGGRDVFVTRLNAEGNAIIYSTYLGGTYADEGRAITVDWLGQAYAQDARPHPTSRPPVPTMPHRACPGTCS
jgi:hypothetical protein